MEVDPVPDSWAGLRSGWCSAHTVPWDVVALETFPHLAFWEAAKAITVSVRYYP